MYEVWKAPATCSGMTRARSGGVAASRARPSRDPAATTWPAPLTFAGTSPAVAIAASTSDGSPPRTALIPVGTSAAASAMNDARAETRDTASTSSRTPATAAALNSPTEWPAVTSTTSRAARPSSTAPSASSDAETINGCATAVSRIVSASESVPWVRRSTPDAAERTASRSSAPGRSSHGLRNPGVCEPWPGQRMASTPPLCRTVGLGRGHGAHQGSPDRLSGTYKRVPGQAIPDPSSRPRASAIWRT